jgi:hypothetical protein
MTTKNLNDLVIRTAVVARPGVGFIYACDPERENNHDPHTYVFKWTNGSLNSVEFEYNAHSVGIINDPKHGLVNVSEPGYYSVETQSGVISGDILADSQHTSKNPRINGIRSVATIAGKAYAVGLGGMVYRLDSLDSWTCIDKGLPNHFDAQAIHGFDQNNIYCVGSEGAVWHFNGKKWQMCNLPTNANLTSVLCAGDGKVYIGGHEGMLLCGASDSWRVIENEEWLDDIWDLEWFENELYVSSLVNLYKLKDWKLEPVVFVNGSPSSYYQLSKADGVMWSIGEFDIMSFDGDVWSRVI